MRLDGAFAPWVLLLNYIFWILSTVFFKFFLIFSSFFQKFSVTLYIVRFFDEKTQEPASFLCKTPLDKGFFLAFYIYRYNNPPIYPTIFPFVSRIFLRSLTPRSRTICRPTAFLIANERARRTFYTIFSERPLYIIYKCHACACINYSYFVMIWHIFF